MPRPRFSRRGEVPRLASPPLRVRREATADRRSPRRIPPRRIAPGRATVRGDVLLHPRDPVEGADRRCSGPSARGQRPPLARSPSRNGRVPPTAYSVPQPQGRLYRPSKGPVLPARGPDPRQEPRRVRGPEGRAGLARPRGRRPRMEGGKPFPPEHRPRGRPRDPRPSHLEEPDAAWCDWSHADLADPEPIPANRVAHGAILGCRWDFDGRARLAPLESGNRRDLQVMKGRPFRAPSGPAYLLTLFKVDMARPWRDVVLARISDVARNESRADGRSRCDRRSRTFARLVRREPSRSTLETDPRTGSNPRRRRPPSAHSGGQQRSVLRTIPRAVPDRPRPCRGAAGRCARGMGRPRFLQAGRATACRRPSLPETARPNSAPCPPRGPTPPRHPAAP